VFLITGFMEPLMNNFFESQPYGAKRHITPFVFFAQNRDESESGYFWSCYEQEDLQHSFTGSQGRDWDGPYESAKEAWQDGASSLNSLLD
jgi:hypothetical protein